MSNIFDDVLQSFIIFIPSLLCFLGSFTFENMFCEKKVTI